MQLPDYSKLQLPGVPEPWFIAPEDLRSDLLRELRTEIGAGHALDGRRLVAVAKCGGCDDAIFTVEDTDPVQWVRVHLTWSGSTEASPWPRTEVFLEPHDAFANHTH